MSNNTPDLTNEVISAMESMSISELSSSRDSNLGEFEFLMHVSPVVSDTQMNSLRKAKQIHLSKFLKDVFQMMNPENSLVESQSTPKEPNAEINEVKMESLDSQQNLELYEKEKHTTQILSVDQFNRYKGSVLLQQRLASTYDLDLVNEIKYAVETPKKTTKLSKTPKQDVKKTVFKRKLFSSAVVDLQHGNVNEKNIPQFKLTSPLIQTNRNILNKMAPIQTSEKRYSFLKSLAVNVSTLSLNCDPVALDYRINFASKRQELARCLCDLYNEKLFNNKLEVTLNWNSNRIGTATRCLNRDVLNVKSSKIELNVKILHSADRLRCSLLHEMCHAATWMLHGEDQAGIIFKSWIRKAKLVFPEIPPRMAECHQYCSKPPKKSI